ncbi:hypothetical protein [Xylanimonas protaetiae]|uniref:Uncharacterized protein n=1 Tax=Xylanimonas protaetiae TaxID=2509457 RepID=A0A4P6F2G7_9MICO|nr:hypothetical protein [Xylanimonas protaetiae]QAY68913.1 hypothetical protein ET471_01690 [Xylanimonas protaetiae]
MDREIASLGAREALVFRDHVIGLEATVGRLRRDLVVARYEAEVKAESETRAMAEADRLRGEVDELRRQSDALRADTAVLRAEIASLEGRVASLLASRSMKLGRLATSPVRLVKRLAK